MGACPILLGARRTSAKEHAMLLNILHRIRSRGPLVAPTDGGGANHG